MNIELQNLSKTYPDAGRSLTVLEEVNYCFPSCGTVAILGRSGIGKSTLMHLIGGLDYPTSGKVILNGVDINRLPSDELSRFRGKHVGFIFQSHHLLSDFSALENVAFPLLLQGIEACESRQRAKDCLTKVGLEDRLEHLPGQLSGGEQQRVAIARAAVGRPAVILADEPTGSLDVTTALEVRNLLLEVGTRNTLTENREIASIGEKSDSEGLTGLRDESSLLIVVTHSIEFAESMDVVLEMIPGGSLSLVRGPK